MTPTRPISRAAFRKARKLLRDRRGLAATEFAMLVPMMLVVFVGVSEVGQAISISRKVTITVRTITDLVTQYSALSTSDMSNLVAAATQVIAPYPSNNLAVTVSEISTDSKSNATITWSSNATAYPVGTKVTLPSGISQPNITVIWGQAQYAYTPVLGDKIIGTTNLSDQIYMNPRLCTAIAYGSSISTSTLTTNCAVAASYGSSSSSSSSSSSGSSGSGSSGSGSSGSGSSGSGSSGSGSSGSGSSGSGSSGSSCPYTGFWAFMCSF